MSGGARGVAEVYQAQWTAYLNSAVANAFRQTLAEKPPDPVARIGRLLTTRVDGPAPQFVPAALPSDPLSQAQSDTAYSSRWSAHINAVITQAWKQTFAARPADPVVHLGRLLLAASTAGAVTALEAENASLRAQLERERAMRAIGPSLASSATSEKMARDINLPADDSTATLQAEIAGLRAQVQELTLENEELRQRREQEEEQKREQERQRREREEEQKREQERQRREQEEEQKREQERQRREREQEQKREQVKRGSSVRAVPPDMAAALVALSSEVQAAQPLAQQSATWLRALEHRLKKLADAAGLLAADAEAQAAEEAAPPPAAALGGPPTAQPQANFDGRPVRHGKWFVLHLAYLSTIECEEKCDIHTEFLRDHPNGGERCAGLIAVRLSDEQIKAQGGRIRISSYRWEGMAANAEGVAIPGNYFGFLEHILEHKLILWMDWMANVGVNVPVPETIGYMGLLYADCVVLGDWMLDVDRLGMALSRAWIFQEMSFGALDEEAMGQLFEQLRARGKALCDAPTDGAALSAYVRGCGWVAALLTRRGFESMVRDDPANRCSWYFHIWPGLSMDDLGVDENAFHECWLNANVDLPGVDDNIWFRLTYLCSGQDFACGWEGDWEGHRSDLLSLVCAAPYPSCESLDALLQRYARGFIGAALGCQVSFEADRAEAASAVMRALATARFGVELSTEVVVERAWACVLAEEDTTTTMSGNDIPNGYLRPYSTGKVGEPIVGGSSSFALAPLRLRGARLTIVGNDDEGLMCSYTAADGSVVSFDGMYTVLKGIEAAGLSDKGLSKEVVPEKPTPKLQDAEGREVDTWLCVAETEAFAKAGVEPRLPGKPYRASVAYILFTQPCDEKVAMTSSEVVSLKGDRIISLTATEAVLVDLPAKAPGREVCFYDSSS